MARKLLFFIITLFFFYSIRTSNGQGIKDTTVSLFMITATTAYQVPGGDMAERFGNNFSIGGSFYYKTKRNWLFGLNGNYLFSDQVKEKYIMDNLLTERGDLTTNEGIIGTYELNERGMFATFRAGKIFNQFLSPNPNSGFFLMGGAGLLQHKIDIYEKNRSIPQIRDEYEKGYDRLTNGLAFSEFIGYWYMSESRLINVYAGFEFIHANTKNRRSFDFYEFKKIDDSRTDLLNSFRFGLIVPFNKREPNDFYYN